MIIYGIDFSDSVTPMKIRDAIVKCFYQAHCTETGINPGDQEANQEYCKSTVENIFRQNGDDFDNPDKESLMRAIVGLADFSKNFRPDEIVEEHYGNIKNLIDQL